MSEITADRYQDFLRSKFHFSKGFGFAVDATEVSPILHRHQPDLVRWMVKKGRAALFASFGLGKTMIQLDAGRIIGRHKGGRQLVVAPLGVRPDFFRDAAQLGIDLNFVQRDADLGGDGQYLTNYESVRDGKLDPSLFTSASLDEAAILRSFGSKTYQEFLRLFGNVEFRFVATAMPAPNRYRELINYAGFLGVMDTGLAMTRFFQRNSEQANELTLYPHMEAEFWAWVHSWACFVQRPSDLGYSDEGYELPPIAVRWHEIPDPEAAGGFDDDGQGILVADAALGLQQAAAAKRRSIGARMALAGEIVAAAPDDRFLLWHDLEDERHAIRRAIPEAVEVFGTLDLEERERRIVDFSDGRGRHLATKPILSGSGCNFQRHCHRAVFTGIGFKFHDFIQAIHRIQRFLQQHPVEIDIIYTDAEREIRRDLEAKWRRYDEMVARMSTIIRAHGLSSLGLEDQLGRSIGVTRKVEAGERFRAIQNDAVDECARLADSSVDLIVSSIPFSNQYEYTECYEDFGHADDNARFFEQLDFLTPNLLRALVPGRVAAIHVKDRVRFGNVTGLGMPTIEPFHAETIFHFKKHGFVYCGMITVVTDVVRENAGTYRLGWTEQCKDGSKMGVGLPEYVLLFRKLPTDLSTAFADVRVVKTKEEYSRARWQVDAHAFWRSSGQRLLTAEECRGLSQGELQKAFTAATTNCIYDYEAHVSLGEALDEEGRLAKEFMTLAPASQHPEVWHDVQRMRTLNLEQWRRNQVMHVCPLQFDIVDRLINRFSNPGETVFDPFAGIMTVPYRAIQLGRRGLGIELSAKYFRDGVRHLRSAEMEAAVPTLFDMMGAA